MNIKEEKAKLEAEIAQHEKNITTLKHQLWLEGVMIASKKKIILAIDKQQ